MPNKYFKIPFAENGDRVPVPDETGTTEVSFDSGYTEDYELPKTNLNRKAIERPKNNSLYHDITSNLKFWQENGAPEIVADDGSGTPLSYSKGLVGSLGGVTYVAIVEGTTTVPPSAEWQEIDLSTLNQRVRFVGSISELETLADTALDGDAARLASGAGRDGDFRWDSSDLSSTLVLASATSDSVDDTTDTINDADHPFSDGDGVITQTTVNGLTAQTVYWVVNSTSGSYQLSATLGGGAVDLAGTTNVTIDHLLDPRQGIYVTPTSDKTGGSGSWVRRYDGISSSGGAFSGWFGAKLDAATDDYPAWHAAIDYVGRKGLSVHFSGGSLISKTLTIDKPIGIIGSANLIQNVGDRGGAYLLKGADIIGIEVTNSAGCTLADFAVVGSGTDTKQGIKLTQCGRSKLNRISSIENGSHGIEFNNGNLTSFRDIYVLGNGGGGLLVNGASAPDTNACEFMNIDARGNSGVGIDLDNAWNVFGHGLVAQQNGGAGVRLNNCRQSNVVIYAESNAAGLDIELTSHANCEGNLVYAMFYNGLTDNSAPDQNMIYRALQDADTRAIWDLMQTRALKLPNGDTFTGSLRLKHDTSVRYDFYADESGQPHTVRWKNVSALTDKDADTAIHPLRHHFPVGTIKYNDRIIFSDGDTTPDVSMGEFFLANNSSATTITTFDGGTNGQEITVLANNGNTTLQFSNGSGIQLRGGVDKTLSQYEAIKFRANGSNWWIEV